MDEVVVTHAGGRNVYGRLRAVLDVTDVAVRQIERARDEIELARLAPPQFKLEFLRLHEGARSVDVAALRNPPVLQDLCATRHARLSSSSTARPNCNRATGRLTQHLIPVSHP